MDGIEFALGLVKAKQKEIANSLATQSCKEYAEYTFQCGRYRAYGEMESQLEMYLKRMDDEASRDT